MSLHMRRNPELARVHAGGAEHSAVGNGDLPEQLDDLQPVAVAGYLVHLCSAVGKRNARVCVAVSQTVLALLQLAEQTCVGVALREGEVLFVLCELVELRPDLQHSCFLSGVHCVRIGLGSLFSPGDVPVGEVGEDIESLCVSCVDIRVGKSHDGLVHNVLRRPYVLVLYQPCEVLLWDRADPLAAVELLAACEFAYDIIELNAQLRLAVRGNELCSGAYPVSEEVSAELAGGGFPDPVEVSGLGVVDYLETREDDPSLEVEILEQTVGVKLKKVLAVYVHSFTEYAGEYFNGAFFGRFQHDFVLLMLDLLVILL